MSSKNIQVDQLETHKSRSRRRRITKYMYTSQCGLSRYIQLEREMDTSLHDK